MRKAHSQKFADCGYHLTQQAHYDLAQVHADRIKLKRLELRLSS